jgi:hypothetical protein
LWALVRPYRFLHSRKWNHSIKNNVETMMSFLSATTAKVDPRGGLAVLICFVVGSEAPDEAIRDMPNRAIRNKGSSVGYEPFDRGAMFLEWNSAIDMRVEPRSMYLGRSGDEA